MQNNSFTESDFPLTAPCAYPVFERTYSRRTEKGRESWHEVILRCMQGLKKLGKLTQNQSELVEWAMRNHYCYPSGRWLWVGGTPWLEKEANFKGAYNCTGTNIDCLEMLAQQMEFAMSGCGTGCVLEEKYIKFIPTVQRKVMVEIVGKAGDIPKANRLENTAVVFVEDEVRIMVGDSRQGWANAYLDVLKLATKISPTLPSDELKIMIDIGSVRPEGERINGFGGVANPVKLIEMFSKIAKVLNRAVGRQLTSVEIWQLVDEVALGVVAGNVRRSAGMKQSSSDDHLFAVAKDNLWQVDENGNWSIDSDRDALRMSNATRIYHHVPTYDEVHQAVTKQYYSGEGAIMFSPEAIARANADLLDTPQRKATFIELYLSSPDSAKLFLAEIFKGKHFIDIEAKELEHRLQRYSLNPCGR